VQANAQRRHRRAIAAALKRALGTVLRKGDLVAAGPGAHWFVALLAARARRSKVEISDADLGFAAERMRRTAALALGSREAPRVRCGWSVAELDGTPVVRSLAQSIRGAAVVARLEERRAVTLAALTHELRTPLTAIIGFAERLSEGDLDAERRLRALAIIVEEARRLARLTDELIDLGAWTAGHLRLRRSPCDLRALLTQAADALEQRAARKNVRVVVAGGGVTKLQVDKDRCLQVLVNLIDNAVRYAPAGSTVRATVDRTPSGGRIVISDNGPGFTRSARRALGRPFSAGADGRSGLGLAISKMIVDAHGGSLDVLPGRGGRVVVSFQGD
jgi:signal transduction histidine kinase